MTKHLPAPPRSSALSSPVYVDVLMRKINEAWTRFDFQKAINLMEQACRSSPAQAGLHLNLGHMYGTIHNYAAAERSYDRAIRLAANKTVALAAIGQKCLDFENYALAERYLISAMEQKEIAPATIVKLAEVYERFRRLENAATLVDRALKLDANCAPALLLRARLEHQAGKLETAETLLRAFPEAGDPYLRANAAYELGAVLDRQGRYDEAMTAFLAAKARLLPSASSRIADLKSIRQRIQTLQSNLTSKTLQRWFDRGQSLQPTRRLVLLGGHPRSGTTLLEQILEMHPDIVSAEETDIFHNQTYMPLTLGHPTGDPVLSILEAASNEVLQRSRKRYFRSIELFLGQDIGRRLLIDKNPALTFLIPALIRIFPEIKLLIALRDPRDVVLSCFMQPFKPGIFSSPFLTMEGSVSEYAAMMGLWQTIKPMLDGHFMEVRYENLIVNPDSVSRSTLDFLGVPWNSRVLDFVGHARKKPVRSPTYAEVGKPIHNRAVGRWQHYQKYLEPYLTKLDQFVYLFGYG